ncbi:MAG: dihydrofolate reductase [Burkholderiales bacterium]
MKPKVVLIAAVAPERLIGGDNRMPWHMPRDLRFFRRATLNHVVIMGRKTFESLGKKALPRRKNVVVTRNPDYDAPGCKVALSVESAIGIHPDEKVVFVIGGGQIYSEALGLADEILLTNIVDTNPNLKLFPPFRGDTYFPRFESAKWQLVKQGRMYRAASRTPVQDGLDHGGLYMQFVRYRANNSQLTGEPT